MMKQLSVVILSVVISFNSFSQIIDFKNDKYWIDIGGIGGFYATHHISGLSGFPYYASINLFNDKTFYKLNFVANAEFNLGGDVPGEEYYSGGILIGKGILKKYFLIEISGGLGFTTGIIRGDFLNSNYGNDYYEKDKFITFSIPAQLDLLFIPIKYIGIGVNLYGDLNFTRSYCGFTIKLSLGKLR